MVKLIALYRKPENTEAFESHYFDTHTPLVKKLPGLRRLEVARITGAPIGEAKHHLIAEMYFDDEDSMQRALASAEGKATASDLMQFAGSLVTLFFAEVEQL